MKGLVMRKFIVILAVIAFALVHHSAWAQVAISGSVTDQDEFTPIEGAAVTFSGITETNDTIVCQFFTDTLGLFYDSIAAGSYCIWASAEGYETSFWPDSLLIFEDSLLINVGFVLHEVYEPVRYVAARQFTNDLVRVSWSMHDPLLYEDFETGDFSRFAWNNTISEHPWAIDSTHAYEGGYCMKSTCEGEGGGVSQIEVSVYVPLEGKMSFYSKISSESPWDMGRFYLDGVKKMECSGEEDWAEHEFDITVGEHVFRWDYVKDASTEVGDDCFYVDCIRFYRADSAKCNRSFRYYDLFRSRFGETPVLMASHLTDTVFMEMNWNSLPWGKYRWGVSCYYEGNRGSSDTIWSAYLDKDMTTTLEVNATTNVGIVPAGATLALTSHDGQGHDYQAQLDANGHLVMPNVYRDAYDLRLHLDGFVDYVSDSALSVMMPTQIDIELMEAISGIDSLYVSSTGWAMWWLEEAKDRDLQYFEIQLNGVDAGTTINDRVQLDVSQLTEGDTCVTKVRPVYLSGAGEWRVCQWVYRPCSNFAGSPSGLSWALHNEALQLSWGYPEGNFLGAMLFREGEYLGFVEGNTYLDETVELHGEVEYCLRLVYGGNLDGTYHSMSCTQCTTAVFPAYCDPPAKLDAVMYDDGGDDFGALVSWGERPEPINQWLGYDNGIFKRSLGGGDEPRIFWAIRFDADTLAHYAGSALKKVSLYDVGAGTYQLWVYVGGDTAPRTLVRSQSMTLAGTNAWHEEAITPAYVIPEGEPIWIVVGQQGLSRPAAACQDMGEADGRWVSLDGETWTDMHTFNMNYTWMLRAFFSNQRGQWLTLGRDGYTLQHYNLYRSQDNVDYQQIASVPAVDGQLYYEYRDNLSEVMNDYVYYRLTAFYLSDNGETCESDYATAFDDPSQNYVVIDVTATDEREAVELQLYPNPTNGRITVEAKGMRRLEVFNAKGQRVMVEKPNADAHQLQLSGLQAGLYGLRIETVKGVTVKRFVVCGE